MQQRQTFKGYQHFHYWFFSSSGSALKEKEIFWGLLHYVKHEILAPHSSYSLPFCTAVGPSSLIVTAVVAPKTALKVGKSRGSVIMFHKKVFVESS